MFTSSAQLDGTIKRNWLEQKQKTTTTQKTTTKKTTTTKQQQQHQKNKNNVERSKTRNNFVAIVKSHSDQSFRSEKE